MKYYLSSKDNGLFSLVLCRLSDHITLVSLHMLSLKKGIFMSCKILRLTFPPHRWLFKIMWSYSVLVLRIHNFTSIHRCCYYTGKYDKGRKIRPNCILTIKPYVCTTGFGLTAVKCIKYITYYTSFKKKKIRKKW